MRFLVIFLAAASAELVRGRGVGRLRATASNKVVPHELLEPLGSPPALAAELLAPTKLIPAFHSAPVADKANGAEEKVWTELQGLPESMQDDFKERVLQTDKRTTLKSLKHVNGAPHKISDELKVGVDDIKLSKQVKLKERSIKHAQKKAHAANALRKEAQKKKRMSHKEAEEARKKFQGVSQKQAYLKRLQTQGLASPPQYAVKAAVAWVPFKPVQGACSQFSCPTGYSRKHNAAMILCLDRNCTDTADQVAVCCADVGRCNTYSCPAGHAHKVFNQMMNCPTAAANKSLANRTVGCVASNATTAHCCDPLDTCSENACPDGFALKAGALGKPCKDRFCGSKDMDTCCARTGICSSYNCPTNFVLKSAADTRACLDETCNMTAATVCCTSPNTCASFNCPAGSFSNGATQACFTGNCTAPQCCKSQVSCSKLSPPKGYVLKKTAVKTYCQTDECTLADLNTCAQPEGHCSSYTCPANFVLRQNAPNILCEDKACLQNTTNTNRCCAKEHSCEAFTCPASFALKEDAVNKTCFGWKCQQDRRADIDICCDRVSTCNTQFCPAGKISRSDSAFLNCKGYACTNVDDDTCCAPASHCATYACPANFLHKENLQWLYCNGKDKDCQEKCCQPQFMCSTFKCPTNFLLKVNATTSRCKGWACTGEDLSTCCDEVATCSSFTCPSGFQAQRLANTTACSGATCTNEDLHTCCLQQNTCASFTCPTGFTHSPPSLRSTLPLLAATAVAQCCAPLGKCSSMRCPANKAQVENAAEKLCNAWKCTHSDESSCCEDKMTCNKHKCGNGSTTTALTLRGHANSLFCAGSKCTVADDQACCALKGTCGTHSCAQIYRQRFNAATMKCPEATCLATNAVNQHTCCAVKGTCSTYTCPSNYQHVSNAERLFCKSVPCGEIDLDTCCYNQNGTKVTQVTDTRPKLVWSQMKLLHQQQEVQAMQGPGPSSII